MALTLVVVTPQISRRSLTSPVSSSATLPFASSMGRPPSVVAVSCPRARRSPRTTSSPFHLRRRSTSVSSTGPPSLHLSARSLSTRPSTFLCSGRCALRCALRRCSARAGPSRPSSTQLRARTRAKSKSPRRSPISFRALTSLSPLRRRNTSPLTSESFARTVTRFVRRRNSWVLKWRMSCPLLLRSLLSATPVGLSVVSSVGYHELTAIASH